MEGGILHAASGIDCGRLNLDVQNARRYILRCERKCGVPLVKCTGYRDRGADGELNRAGLRCNRENWRFESSPGVTAQRMRKGTGLRVA
jgi:hypothetical protein